MNLIIAEYLRTLKERDELDRLLPDLLTEMGYEIIARPQTGNRQAGVDLPARGKNMEDGQDELLLFVIKKGDIGRPEWDGNPQAVRPSINEILDIYLKSHVEPQDEKCVKRIIVATNGDLKQTVLANWTGFISDNAVKAKIEFWGIDKLADLVNKYLLSEHIFQDEDRKLLRRALALSADNDYDQRDLNLLFRRTLGLLHDGKLEENPKTGKGLLKALQIVNLSVHIFASWAINDGNARQAILAMERALVWTWHRLLLSDEPTREAAMHGAFGLIYLGYLNTSQQYVERLQAHCYVEDGLSGYSSNGCEFSVVAFEMIGILATICIAQLFPGSKDSEINKIRLNNISIVVEALKEMIKNNGICNSPCLDRHSQDITLAMFLFSITGNHETAKDWIRKLVINIDYAYKGMRFIPICTDSFDDLADESGWASGKTDKRLMQTSWTLPVLAGWCAILGMEEEYKVLARGSKESYPEVCMQLWHPDSNLYQHLYFRQAQYDSGLSEAPIILPEQLSEWRENIKIILDSDQAEIFKESIAAQKGFLILDLLACRHFSTPVAPYLWYQRSNQTQCA